MENRILQHPNNQKPATHFVEVYKGVRKNDKVYHTPLLPIDDLEDTLFGTTLTSLKTILVAKIRMKENYLVENII